MAEVALTTLLDCSPVEAWGWVRAPALLQHISHPLIRFTPDRGNLLPEVWEPGEYRLWLHLFGRIPLGWQAVVITFPEPSQTTRFMRDNGYSPSIRRWDHWIEIAPACGGKTRYTDRVTIEAGWRTPLVAAFARQLYAHRQRRWRALARSGFAALDLPGSAA
jgi:hypothetical protein